MSAATTEQLAGSSMLTYSGTRHRTGRRLNSIYCIGACAESIFLPLKVQLRIKHKRDCKRCFPPDSFSSSTLTDLQEAQQQREQARDIAVRLEQENARMADALRLISRHGCEGSVAPYNCQDAGLTPGAYYGADAWCDPCIAMDALAAAPVDGAE